MLQNNKTLLSRIVHDSSARADETWILLFKSIFLAYGSRCFLRCLASSHHMGLAIRFFSVDLFAFIDLMTKHRLISGFTSYHNEWLQTCAVRRWSSLTDEHQKNADCTAAKLGCCFCVVIWMTILYTRVFVMTTSAQSFAHHELLTTISRHDIIFLNIDQSRNA